MMIMKKVGLLMVMMMLVAVIATGCGGEKNSSDVKATNTPATNQSGTESNQEGYADGTYYAEATPKEDSEWQEVIALQVEDGKIVSVNWNALNTSGGLDKKTFSELGHYGMKVKGKAAAEWHEQAATLEKFLIEKQDPAAVVVNDEGKTDAVSGVSITASGFAQLADAALKAGPVERGAYKDGSYYAEGASFDENSGWKETVNITVMNGNIVAASWNGVHKDGGTDKVARSKSGEYGMKEKGNAIAEWHEQAFNAEQFLIEKQDPAAIPYGDDGNTDAIAGVSIHVNGFVELATKALSNAK
jgi:major membrane immunogen (membrane-anchored lipoprotein)